MLQKQVREQCPNAKFVAMDTMNFWITSMKDAVIETIKVVDCVIINDAEARQLTDEPNIHKAARKIMNYGLKAVVIKRGEYGATLFTKGGFFSVPAYPLESVFDPTGAGDTFAGGFMGYLASQEEITDDVLRRAMIYGSVMASFNVAEFGTERVDVLDYPEINQRFRDFKRMTHFEDIPFEGRQLQASQPQKIVVLSLSAWFRPSPHGKTIRQFDRYFFAAFVCLPGRGGSGFREVGLLAGLFIALAVRNWPMVIVSLIALGGLTAFAYLSLTRIRRLVAVGERDRIDWDTAPPTCSGRA